MNEITVRFRSENKPFDPDFFEHLSAVAEEHGVTMDRNDTPVSETEDAHQRHLRHEEIVRRIIGIRDQIGPIEGDSAEEIRRSRDNL